MSVGSRFRRAAFRPVRRTPRAGMFDSFPRFVVGIKQKYLFRPIVTAIDKGKNGKRRS